MIFISHSTVDKKYAEELYEYLILNGYRNDQLFLDSDRNSGVELGQDFTNFILSKLENSSALIVMWSNHWNNSEWCFGELLIAINLKIPIIPIAIHEGSFPPPLDRFQAIFYYKDPNSFNVLLHSLNKQYLSPDDLSKLKNKSAKTIDQYRKELKKLDVSNIDLNTRTDYLKISSCDSNVQNFLIWAAKRKIPSVEEIDSIMCGDNLSSLNLKISEAIEEQDNSLLRMESSLRETEQEKNSTLQKIRDIEETTPPIKPVNNNPQQDQWFRERLEQYKKDYEGFRDLQNSIPSLRNQLNSINQQISQKQNQIENLRISHNRTISNYEKQIPIARSQDIVYLISSVFYKVKNTSNNQKFLVLNFYILLSIKILIPVFQPFIISSWSSVNQINIEIGNMLEFLTKSSYIIISKDFFARWLFLQKILENNRNEYNSIKSILNWLPSDDFKDTCNKIEILTTAKIPEVPDFSILYDTSTIPDENIDLNKKINEVEKRLISCNNYLNSILHIFRGVNAAKKDVKLKLNKINEKVDTSVSMLKDTDVMAKILISAGKENLPIHTKAFSKEILFDLNKRLKEDHNLFVQDCLQTNFWQKSANNYISSHVSNQFLDSYEYLKKYIVDLVNNQIEIENAKLKLENRPSEIYTEYSRIAKRTTNRCLLPLLQLYSSINIISDKYLKTVLMSEHNKLLPIKSKFQDSIAYSIIITGMYLYIEFIVFAFHLAKDPSLYSVENYFFWGWIVMIFTTFLTLTLFVIAMARISNWIKINVSKKSESSSSKLS